MVKTWYWKCEYCYKHSTSKGVITKHEKHCYKNPNRIPREGELAIWDTFPRELMVDDSYGVIGSDFQHPKEHPAKELLEKFKWWPLDQGGCLGLGFIYLNDEWFAIPGYIPPHFAPGFSWRPEIIPQWLKEVSSTGRCKDIELAMEGCDIWQPKEGQS